jgi:hypothetical protein
MNSLLYFLVRQWFSLSDIVKMIKSKNLRLVGKVECKETANVGTELSFENPKSPQ